MRKILLTVILFSAVLFAKGQQVLSAAGNSGGNAEVVVDWTLGEPVIETLSNTSGVLTQGLHQTRLIITAINDLTILGVEISAFPNPTSGLLNIKIEQAGNHAYSYRIETPEGRYVAQNPVFPGNGQIHLGTLATGVYILSIVPDNRKWVKTFKIVKQ